MQLRAARTPRTTGRASTCRRRTARGPLTIFAVAKQGNEEPEVGSVAPGSDFATNIVVFRYVQTFNLAGRQLTPFLILPFGGTRTLVDAADHGAMESSSGLGDVQIGGVLGLLGSPALSPQDFAVAKPGFSTGLFAKLYLPTGAYNAAQIANLGANRFAFQVGLPTTFALGTSYRDPALTTLELFPTLTFYQDNDEPHGANPEREGRTVQRRGTSDAQSQPRLLGLGRPALPPGRRDVH